MTNFALFICSENENNKNVLLRYIIKSKRLHFSLAKIIFNRKKEETKIIEDIENDQINRYDAFKLT